MDLEALDVYDELSGHEYKNESRDTFVAQVAGAIRMLFFFFL